MRYTILAGVIILLAAAPAQAQHVKQTVSWQYYARDVAVGNPVPPADAKVNFRCSVIASDADGAWVCLYVDAIPKSKLPDNKSANACRPLGKDGQPFKLTDPALLPDSDTTQVVAFVSGNTETMYKLVVKKDGQVEFEIIGPTFTGETRMSGAASVCWYVSKKK